MGNNNGPASRSAAERLTYLRPHVSDVDEIPEDQRGDAWEDSSTDKPTVGQAVATAANTDRQPSDAYVFRPIDSRAFASATYTLKWIVQRWLVELQPILLGGPRKSLKTNILIDLVLSIATGTPFLGAFNVYGKRRVCLISGESGQAVIQETARRICAAKGLNLADVDVLWDFRLPRLAVATELKELQAGLRDNDVRFVAVDPAYLALLAGVPDIDASNIFSMGPLLLGIADACLNVGVTPLLCHHTRKNLTNPNEPLDLSDLSHAAFAEFARQWILVNRRKPYRPGSGLHKLNLSVGGSAGQSGLWALDLHEGQLNDDFSGRGWNVTVASAQEADEADADAKEVERGRQREKKDKANEAKVLNAVDDLADPDGIAVYSRVRDETGLNSTALSRAIHRLQKDGFLIEVPTVAAVVPGKKGQREVRGLRRPKRDAGT